MLVILWLNSVMTTRYDMIDIGSNLTHASFAPDRAEVIARATRAGVVQQIVTGADLASSIEASMLAAANADVLSSTAGVHPHHAAGFEPAQLAGFRRLLALPGTVAVGECGLDYQRNFSPHEAQRRAFAAQLELAAELHKPVFLHQRDAHADFLAMLAEFAPRLSGGVAHCFTGGIAELEAYLALGLAVGVTGWICDERRGAALREAVPHIPAERLLLETDAPYLLPRDLSPQPKSRRNEPGNLPHIAHAVARARGEPLSLVAAATTRNARRLFGLNDPAGTNPTGSYPTGS
jgi:TatD DNase family protein